MKNSDILKRCAELERPLDKHLFQVYRDESGQFVNEAGQPVSTADRIKAGATATAIGVGGGLVGVRALKKRYGANYAADDTKAGQALVRGVSRDVQTAGTAVAGQARSALEKIKKSGIIGKVGGFLKGVTKFDARTKLIELAAK